MKKTTELNAHPDFRGMQENYKNLLKARQSETAEETQIQCKEEKEFQQITIRQAGGQKGKNYRNHNKESN